MTDNVASPYQRKISANQVTFRDHHTEINNLIWSFIPVYYHAQYLRRHGSVASPAELFHASGPDVHRLDHSLVKWKVNFSLFYNWCRLSAVVSMLAYFEVYLRKTIILSIRSDPGTRFGKKHAIEGCQWLKLGIRDDIDKAVESCVKGEWPKRVKAYKDLFGSVPVKLQNSVGQLDQMRTLRNEVGHAFGRDLTIKDFLSLTPEPMKHISEDTLKEWLTTVYDIAVDIDAHLVTEHLGCFETLLYYHKFKHSLKGDHVLITIAPRMLRKALAIDYRGRKPSFEYCRDIIEYYQGC